MDSMMLTKKKCNDLLIGKKNGPSEITRKSKDVLHHVRLLNNKHILLFAFWGLFSIIILISQHIYLLYKVEMVRSK